MKIPGVGEVKNKNVAYGAAVVVGIVGYAYWKRRRNQQTGAALGTSATVDPNAIDPNTGIPYGQETGFGAASSIPNPYVTQTGSTSGTTVSGTAITDNGSWLATAEQEAVNGFGVSFGTATSAFGKYLRQDPKGLNSDEYAAVSETLAVVGQPPTGGPYRLIQAIPAPPVPSGGGTGSDNDGGGTPAPEPAPTPEPTPISSTSRDNPDPGIFVAPQPMPAPAPAPAPPPVSSGLNLATYRVQPGDSYSSIASKFNVPGGAQGLYNINTNPQYNSAYATFQRQGIGLLYVNQTIHYPH